MDLDLAQGFKQIHVGMTLPEVEKVMGGPAGHYGAEELRSAIMTMEGAEPPGGPHVAKAWSNDSARFEIYFNKQAIVVGKHRRRGFAPNPE